MPPKKKPESTEPISLDNLVKLLPTKFTNDETKIRSFIKQVDSVFKLASPSQKHVLLLLVKNQINGKAGDLIDSHPNLTTWEEISELLVNSCQDKRSLNQLMEEFNSMEQYRNENVSQFHQRLEDLQSRIISIHSADRKDDTLAGRIAMINEMTLNRFIYHSHPQISEMLRNRNFKNLGSALTMAMAAEIALGLKYDNFQQCTICKKSNHDTNDCYFGQQISSRNEAVNSTQFNRIHPGNIVKQCRYCKKFGHDVQNCRHLQSRINNGSNCYSNNGNPQTGQYNKYGNQASPNVSHQSILSNLSNHGIHQQNSKSENAHSQHQVPSNVRSRLPRSKSAQRINEAFWELNLPKPETLQGAATTFTKSQEFF